MDRVDSLRSILKNARFAFWTVKCLLFFLSKPNMLFCSLRSQKSAFLLDEEFKKVHFILLSELNMLFYSPWGQRMSFCSPKSQNKRSLHSFSVIQVFSGLKMILNIIQSQNNFVHSSLGWKSMFSLEFDNLIEKRNFFMTSLHV